MALDIVYGYQGKDHVKASQLGRLLAGTIGAGRYVLDTQDGMAAKMQTANKVRIGTGDLVMDNRYVTNEAYQDLTVESGQSGYNRNDLVCVKYERAAGSDPDHSVESMELVVIKGTPTTGTASDPSYTAGDISAQDSAAIMPLWRLPINGLTVGNPVQLFKKHVSCSKFRDSVSQLSCRAAKDLRMPIVAGWSGWEVDAFDAFADIPLASVAFVAVSVSAGTIKNEGIEARWNTYGGKCRVELYSPVAQDAYINVMVWWRA